MTDESPTAPAAAPQPEWPNAPTPDEQPEPSKRAPRERKAVAGAIAPAATEQGEFKVLPLEVLRESPLNPRKHWIEQQIRDLADSLKPPVGMIEPMVVRPHPRGGGATYEIVAGGKRFRAAKVAGLVEVPCIVRHLTDAQVIALMVIENNQRGGLHPLDEAQGFVDWMKLAGVDVPGIAAQLGHSIKYVYDRVKLLSLTKTVKALFLADRITAGHAILLARLSPKDQARASEEQEGGLWDTEEAHEVDDDGQPAELALDDQRKPRSVRELATWINDHVRAEDALVTDPILFPETAAALATAQERKLRVVEITHEHFVQPEARAAEGRRYGPQSWVYADGKEHDPPNGWGKAKTWRTCEHAVLGVVRAGERRGESYLVCVAKEKCAAHWPEQVKKAQARKTAAAAPPAKKSGSTGDGKPTPAPKSKAVPFAGRAAIAAAERKRVPVIAAAIEKIAKVELKALSDVLAWNIMGWMMSPLEEFAGRMWSAAGKQAAYFDYELVEFDTVRAIIAALPIKLRGYEPTDAKAARHLIAVYIYFARDFDAKKFDAAVLAEAQAAVKAAQEKAAAAAPMKGAKPKAAAKKATGTKGR